MSEMWEPPRKDDHNSKKRLRQITLAQAFRTYNKKLKSEVGGPSGREGASAGPSSIANVVAVVPSENDDDKTESGDSGSCEIVDEIPSSCKDSQETEPAVAPNDAESDGRSTFDVSLDLFPESCSPTPICSGTDESNSDELLSFVTSLISRPQLGVLESGPDHTVLVKCPLSSSKEAVPEPYPELYFDAWDGDHVRLPCSPSNLYPIRTESGEKKIESRWEMIRNSFSVPVTCCAELEEAILQYNSQYARRWNFRGLRDFFPSVLEEEEVQIFFRCLLPRIIRLALSLPEVCTRPIPLLKRHRDRSITLSQKQIACLLANAFLCTFPRRNASGRGSEYDRFPSINFNQLFSYSGPDAGRKHQKLLCIMNYFRRVTLKEPTGLVTFHRQYVRDCPDWKESATALGRFYVRSEGTIEEGGSGMLQVDFANSFVGGGVLNTGLVQEEIRFVICPELIVSRLFTECLDASEVLVATGCERFNAYSGYSDTFTWEGDFKDQTPRDEWGRIMTEIVAIDALHFTCKDIQYKKDFLKRELRKAYSGFYAREGHPLSAVATGNWGCGVFGGDAKLKALLQYMAASEAGRDVAYFTFGEDDLAEELKKMVGFLRKRNVVVGQLWKVLAGYYDACVSGVSERVHLYDYIRTSLA